MPSWQVQIESVDIAVSSRKRSHRLAVGGQSSKTADIPVAPHKLFPGGYRSYPAARHCDSEDLALFGGQVLAGKAEVKPESGAALQEIVKLLKQDGKLKVYVVGHTDNVGALAANIELSRRRAAAVAQALTTQYGVAADRLLAYGDGPCAPLASNDSDDGRALNRRVELVKQ